MRDLLWWAGDVRLLTKKEPDRPGCEIVSLAYHERRPAAGVTASPRRNRRARRLPYVATRSESCEIKAQPGPRALARPGIASSVDRQIRPSACACGLSLSAR